MKPKFCAASETAQGFEELKEYFAGNRELLLRKLARLPDWAPRIARLPLGQRVVSTTGRHQFYTVRIVDGGHVSWRAGRTPSNVM